MPTVSLTDHERAFADSPHGRNLIARARNRHETAEAYKGRDARPWTDALEVAAVRALVTSDARSTVATTAMMADSERQIADGRVRRDAARVARAAQVRDAWKGGGR